MADLDKSGESEITAAPAMTSRCGHHGRDSPDSFGGGGLDVRWVVWWWSLSNRLCDDSLLASGLQRKRCGGQCNG